MAAHGRRRSAALQLTARPRTSGAACLLTLVTIVASTVFSSHWAIDFVLGPARRSGLGYGRVLGTPRHAETEIAGVMNTQTPLYSTLLLAVATLPGVVSTLQRTGQAKFIEKTYMMPGTATGGLEMRSIAGGVTAYFRSLNYKIEDSSQKGRIRFIGNMQGSISQASFLTLVVLGCFAAVGIIVQSLFPEGPFGLGPNVWFAPCVFSPWAGWYYWGRAFRRDIVELSLEMSDDLTTTTLCALGDQETIEALQKGVRFQSPTGKLYQLTEPGADYQPGIFDNDTPLIVAEPQKTLQTEAKQATQKTPA